MAISMETNDVSFFVSFAIDDDSSCNLRFCVYQADLAVFRRSTGFWYTLMLGGSGIQQTKHWGFTKNDTSCK